jgi:mono/diheme cytochrome c family protein
MNTNQIKIYAIAIMILPLLALTVFNFNVTTVSAVSDNNDDTAAIYKAKCALCHKPAADKFYDPEMPVEEQVQIILKGKKAEKPPHMPEFETKGIDTEKATALAEYMKELRTPPSN